MAVDKMELLKRYKELKAQGVQITLMELKKQLEGTGVNSVADTQNNPRELTFPLQGRGQGEGLTSFSQPQTYSAPKTDSSPAFVSSFNPEGTGVNSAANTHGTSQVSAFSGVNVATDTQNVSQELTFPLQGRADFGKSGENRTRLGESCVEPVEPPKSKTGQGEGSIPLMQPEPIKYSGNFSSAETPAEVSETKKYALIGYPLGHSLSSYIHNAGFGSLVMDFSYEILETSPDSLVDRIKYLKFNGYSGFNVTIPLKLPVTMFLDEVDISADVIGAVNTVVINPDKTMKGYNTDVIGFRKAIPDDVTLPGKVAGVLGTGGAARAAITALAQNQVKEIKIYTRNIPNSIELLNFLRSKFPNVEFNAYQIERIRDLSDVQILVNATPIGMQGRAADLTPVEENELRTLPQGAVVYDVIYNPKKTVLLKLAQKNGYRTINGVDMFIYQALVAEQIWTGRTPDFKDMKIAALENL